jgi:hypothetical protein
MKITYTSLIVTTLALIIFSCSKKNISGTNQNNYKKYSQQLEMNYESHNSILSASANENEITIPKANSRFETIVPEAQTLKLNNGKNITLKKLFRIDKNNPFHNAILKK